MFLLSDGFILRLSTVGRFPIGQQAAQLAAALS
jgi:hypothetical protein